MNGFFSRLRGRTAETPQPAAAPATVDRTLIYDLGMHHALDAAFYLAKGFNVVALEANPDFIRRAETAHATEIAQGRLHLVDRALWDATDTEIAFYVNAEKDDWSSALKSWAEKGGHTSREIRVKTLTLADLFDRYGVPYYLKCDIEGADDLFARQLHADTRRPTYVSVEASSLSLLALLHAAGYDRFQIVNQGLHHITEAPSPAREGTYVDAKFNGHMSGLFGRELAPKAWVDFDTIARNFVDFVRMKRQDAALAFGWIDFHATTVEELARP